MIDPVPFALNHLGLDTDPERAEDGSYLTSVVDLRITGDNYAYVTIVWTDNGDSEKVAVVRVQDKPRKVVTETIMEAEL